jgi:hypothetical protein
LLHWHGKCTAASTRPEPAAAAAATAYWPLLLLLLLAACYACELSAVVGIECCHLAEPFLAVQAPCGGVGVLNVQEQQGRPVVDRKHSTAQQQDAISSRSDYS